MKKIIIVTSRKYFAKANGAVSVAGSEFADLFRNEYLSSIELEDEDKEYVESVEDPEEKTRLEFKIKLYSFFSRDMEHSFIADYMVEWFEDETVEFPVKKFTTASDYVVYLAPCYPLWTDFSDFNLRQNYLASIVDICLADAGDYDSICVISHDKDIYPDHLCKNPEASDLKEGCGLERLINEGTMNLSDIYCYMHSRSSDMYVEFVENLPSGVTVPMCEMAEKIVRFSLK